jgi:hypothetical protein
MWHLPLHVWRISSNIMSYSSIHFSANSRIPFFLNNWKLLYVWFICLFTDGHLGWFHTLAVVNSSAINMGVQESLWYAISLYLNVYPARGHSIFNFLRNFHIAHYIGCTNLHYYQLGRRVPFTSHYCQYLSFFFFCQETERKQKKNASEHWNDKDFLHKV